MRELKKTVHKYDANGDILPCLQTLAHIQQAWKIARASWRSSFAELDKASIQLILNTL